MNATTLLSEQLNRDFTWFIQKLQVRMDKYNKHAAERNQYCVMFRELPPILKFDALTANRNRNDILFIYTDGYMKSIQRMTHCLTYHVHVPYYSYWLMFSFTLDCFPYCDVFDVNNNMQDFLYCRNFMEKIVKDIIICPEVLTFRSYEDKPMDIVNDKQIRGSLQATYIKCAAGQFESARALVETYADNKDALRIIVDMVLKQATLNYDVELQAYILDISNKYHLSDSVEDMTL